MKVFYMRKFINLSISTILTYLTELFIYKFASKMTQEFTNNDKNNPK